jgi:quinol monooxygenase YgiN
MRTELFIIARFHAKEGNENAVAEAIREVAKPTRAEAGCLAYGAYRSARDSQLFFIYSQWVDEGAFEAHAELPHTVRFIERVERLIDHALEVNRVHSILETGLSLYPERRPAE